MDICLTKCKKQSHFFLQVNILILATLTIFTFTYSLAFSKSLDKYLKDLLEQNNQIKSYEAQKNQAKEMLWQAKSNYMPRVDLHSQAGKENIYREDADNTYKTRTYLNLKASQLITDFGKTTSEIQRSVNQFEQADLQLDMMRKEVLMEGITAYLQVLQSREELKYARRSENNIKEQTGIEETLVRKGAGLSSDVLQARAQLSGARALRVRAEGNLENAINRFDAIFHTSLSKDQIDLLIEPELAREILPNTRQEAVQKALEDNPQLLILEKALQVSQDEVSIQKSTLFPKFNLFAEYEYKDNDSGIDGYRNEARAGLELTYNLFSSGGDWAAIKAARENKTSVLKNLKFQKRQIEKQTRNDWNNFLMQTENHRFLQNQARIANEYLELAKKERKLGNRSLLDILSGETEYIRSVSDAVAAAISRKLAAYKLLYTTGDLSINTIR